MIHGAAELVTQPIYDTIYLPEAIVPGRSLAHGFVLPLGLEVSVKNGKKIKTDVDTNLFCPGMLDAPKKHTVNAIECYFVGEEAILPADSRWYAESKIEFILSCKVMYEAPLAKCVAPAAIFDLKRDVLLTKEDFEALKKQFQTKLPQNILIESQENFQVRVYFSEWCRWSSRSAPEKLVISLEGTLQRAVC